MMLIQNKNQCPGKQEKNKYSSVSWAFHMPQKNYKYHLSSIINFKKILMICLTGEEQRYSCLLFLFFFLYWDYFVSWNIICQILTRNWQSIVIAFLVINSQLVILLAVLFSIWILGRFGWESSLLDIQLLHPHPPLKTWKSSNDPICVSFSQVEDEH